MLAEDPQTYTGQGQGLAVFIPIIIAGALLFLRNRKPRPLRLNFLWVRPALSLLAVGALLYVAPPAPTVLNLAILAAGLLLGGALGWQRGRFTQLEVDPATHAVTARVSPLGMLFVLGLIALRAYLRQNVSALGALSSVVTDSLLLMAAGMMIVQQVEVSLRGRRMLETAKAGSSAPDPA